MKKQTKSGFTLIELLVVVAVIGSISGIVLASLNSARVKARNAQRLQSIESIAKAFQVATTGAYNNQFPSTGGSSVCLGITTGTCWGTANAPAAPPLVNDILKNGLAGNIPLDAFYSTGNYGDRYLYNSSGGSPLGAILLWRMEEGGGASCGRGVQITSPLYFLCQLYLGPPTS